MPVEDIMELFEYVTIFLFIFLNLIRKNFTHLQLQGGKITKVRYTIFSSYFGKTFLFFLPKYTYYFVYLCFKNMLLQRGPGSYLIKKSIYKKKDNP